MSEPALLEKWAEGFKVECKAHGINPSTVVKEAQEAGLDKQGTGLGVAATIAFLGLAGLDSYINAKRPDPQSFNPALVGGVLGTLTGGQIGALKSVPEDEEHKQKKRLRNALYGAIGGGSLGALGGVVYDGLTL